MCIVPKIASEVALFIIRPDGLTTFDICYQSLTKYRNDFLKVFSQEQIDRYLPSQDSAIDIALRGRAFQIRGRKIQHCQIDGKVERPDFVKVLWPDQETVITIGPASFKFYVRHCRD